MSFFSCSASWPWPFLQLLHQLVELFRRQRLRRLSLLVAGAAALVQLERLVHQLLLLAHHLRELVHLPHGLRSIGCLAGLRHLQIVEHLLQLAQKLLRRVAVAELRQLLDAVEHLLQVLLRQLLHLLVALLLRHVLQPALLHLRHVALQEFLHRLPELVRKPSNFLVRGAVLQRLLERLARRLQTLLGVRHVAVLDGARHRPEIVEHLFEVVVAPRVDELACAKRRPR